MTGNGKSEVPSPAHVRSFQPEVLAKMRRKAQQKGRLRTEAVVAKVRDAMERLKQEIQPPSEGAIAERGKLTNALLFKRAGVHWTTVSKSPERYAELLEEIRLWKLCLQIKTSPDGGRRSPSERVRDSNEMYERLLKNFQIVELELQQAQAERDEAIAQTREAERKCAVLENALESSRGSNVRPFPGPHIRP